MIDIVCFKWGTLFNAEYVNKLYRAIERNVTVPHTFTCFTENPIGIECDTKPFLADLPTWWYIIGLFNKDHGFKNKVLYLDLDTVITGNIDHILNLDVNFAITEDFYRPQGLQTTCIMWKPEWGYFLFDELKKVIGNTKSKHFAHGTNGFVEQHVPKKDITILQDIFPEELISYKVHIKDKHKRILDLPGNLNTANIVFYHGRPRPKEMEHLSWMKEHWI